MKQERSRLAAKDFSQLPQPLQFELQRLQEGHRSLPSFLSLLANAPIILEAYIAFSDAIEHSALSPSLRNKIALAVSELSSSSYDLAAGIEKAQQLDLCTEEISNCRCGRSSVPQHDAILSFATSLLQKNGHLSEAELERLRQFIQDDRAIIEIIATVACTHFSNLLNNLAQTPLDHPNASEIRHSIT